MGGGEDGFEGVVAALFEGAEQGHEDGLAVGTGVAAVAVAVFANEDGGADRAFGVVVIERDAVAIEEREQVILMTAQAFDETLRIWLIPLRRDEVFQPIVESVAATLPRGLVEVVAALPQADRIAEQSPEPLLERAPTRVRLLVLHGVFEFTQQMHEAHLAVRAGDRVVRGPEVRDQCALEFGGEETGQRGRTARTIDQIKRAIDIPKTPQPMRLPIDSPTRFIRVQHG